MSHGQHTTRRALFVGAAAAILAGNVAGTATAEVFSAQEVLQMRAEALILQWHGHGAQLIPQPDGRLFSCVYVDQPQTVEEEAVIERLREKLKADDALRAEVRRQLRKYYGMDA